MSDNAEHPNQADQQSSAGHEAAVGTSRERALHLIEGGHGAGSDSAPEAPERSEACRTLRNMFRTFAGEDLDAFRQALAQAASVDVPVKPAETRAAIDALEGNPDAQKSLIDAFRERFDAAKGGKKAKAPDKNREQAPQSAPAKASRPSRAPERPRSGGVFTEVQAYAAISKVAPFKLKMALQMIASGRNQEGKAADDLLKRLDSLTSAEAIAEAVPADLRGPLMSQLRQLATIGSVTKEKLESHLDAAQCGDNKLAGLLRAIAKGDTHSDLGRTVQPLAAAAVSTWPRRADQATILFSLREDQFGPLRWALTKLIQKPQAPRQS